MTAISRPFRRLFGRAEPVAVDEAAPPPQVATELPGIAVDIPEPTRCSPTSRPRRVPSTCRDSSSTRPRSASCARPGSRWSCPLVTQGELIGTLNLGPRLSEQDYSSDDRRLLTTLAAQAAPAIRVAQLVREQAAEAAERERYEQEMRVATLIQQQFLPRELPNLPEWQIAAYYGPARAVGGDFYDFIEMPRRPDRDRRRRRHRQGRAGRARHGPDPLDPARGGSRG